MSKEPESQCDPISTEKGSDHPAHVKHGMRIAEKHGTLDAHQNGIPFEGKSIEGVKVTKPDYADVDKQDKFK